MIKLLPKWRLRFLITLILLIIFAPGVGYCLSEEEIFEWVANRMEIYEQYPMPQIQTVDKAGIQAAFIQGNKNSFLRWKIEYGQDKAEKILNDYLNEIVGLFNGRDQTIYVGSFIDPCKQQAVLAHEFVHYYQHMTKGAIEAGAFQEDIRRFAREIEAYSIEQELMEVLCPDNDTLVVSTDDY